MFWYCLVLQVGLNGCLYNKLPLYLETFSYFELEKNIKYIYAGIKRIAYLKPGMGFSQGITFF